MTDPSAWAMERARGIGPSDTTRFSPESERRIALALDAAVAEEREACAKIAEHKGRYAVPGDDAPRLKLVNMARNSLGRSIAAAIRARGQS